MTIGMGNIDFNIIWGGIPLVVGTVTALVTFKNASKSNKTTENVAAMNNYGSLADRYEASLVKISDLTVERDKWQRRAIKAEEKIQEIADKKDNPP